LTSLWIAPSEEFFIDEKDVVRVGSLILRVKTIKMPH
jgi:hypothetical protein